MRIEKGGKPAVLSVAPPFREEVASHSKMHGMPYLTFVVLEVTQDALPLIPSSVEKVFDKMVKALTTPVNELEKHIPGEVI